MLLLLNPSICLFISLILSYMQEMQLPRVVPLLGAVIFASLSYIIQKNTYVLGLTILYLLLSCFQKDFLIYLPVVVYMGIRQGRNVKDYFLYLIPILFHSQDIEIDVLILMIITTLFAIGLKQQYLKSEYLKQDYKKQRDATQEVAMLISAKNHDLMIQQEQDIRIATLDERNRIAREIHDSVGHLLSSALLQIGALQVIEKDEMTKTSLVHLRNTISTAMDSVRNSVHDLHEDALDLEAMLTKLIHGFTFCQIEFEYDVIHSFKQRAIYHIAAIAKECMNNVMKHSNASKLMILVREQPSFFQIIFSDNGTIMETSDEGIGLLNIKERVEDMHGYVNISKDQGFRIFITLPKEESICEF